MSDQPLVGLVVVSHSDLIARGVVDLVGETSPDVTVIAAGGTADGRLGTDVERVMQAIRDADTGAGVVVVSDLGSAVMGAETALELLGTDWTRRVVPADGPLVEGAVAAGVRAQTGGVLAEVAQAATGRPDSGSARTIEVGQPSSESTAGYSRSATLINPDGLHARPAAEFVKLATSLGGKVTVNGKDARSLLGILSLGLSQGSSVEIATDDPAATDAVDALVALVESGFGAGS
ncbi:PTS-dependent dihydroxyacetone kinase phosphotransferase subunit DhaM [Planctomonas sp. JC2975]|uniref:dihydroxyacetone kinase phosphoryl donor subunit DhaM n=1 Tax=Planctomonas sp. JC2975 TaxID=2729626 RepID=UPI001473603E|nr:dihydroxyacetone kinase phosphoryl donor subunit DhaM [Planctomonas sp. JC2975]NNC10436.1 PTS-dependent dihydroxyacetone kinase phosphotransferase subunit DhaM [Planctomonas sp. JC2975]